jgi:hypothetical protein
MRRVGVSFILGELELPLLDLFQVVSHIVVKGSRSSKSLVCTGSIQAQHSKAVYFGLEIQASRQVHISTSGYPVYNSD